MAVTLRTTVGTVNFTDWLHVTVQKVPTGSPVVWETWIDVPITSYNFIVPNLDPDNYIMRFYDAPTNSSLGTLTLELIVNALTNEWAYERRFYVVDRGNTGDPVDGDDNITDPYLIGRTITGVHKEGKGYYEPDVDYSFDDTIGKISILTGVALSSEEKMSVEIKYSTGVTGSSGGSGLYTGILDIEDAVYSLLAGDKNKLCRLVGTGATQVITLPLVSSIGLDEGYYFDNSVGGTAKCVRLLLTGTDKVSFNGFDGFDTLTEIWVGRGEHLLLKRINISYWEVRLDYAGVNVGELVMPGTKGMNMVVTENGQLMDGDEWCRMWWWLNNVCPASHKYSSSSVTDPGFTHTANRRGQFCLHPTLKKFRMPSTGGLVPKGLTNMEAYGTDTANRPVDAPGGIQDEMIKKHRHWTVKNKILTGSGVTAGQTMAIQKNDQGEFKYIIVGDASEPDVSRTSDSFGGSYSFGDQQRVNNNGVLFGRRM